MFNKMKRISLIAFLSLISLGAIPQELSLNTGFEGFLDNREYFSEYGHHQTMFGNRIFMEGGVKINEDQGFYAGIDYLYEFGSIEETKKPKLILNYQGTFGPVHVSFGSFHRTQLNNYPLALLTDTLRYYRPLIEGARVKYNFRGGWENMWIDWTSRQTDSVRETFLAGFSGMVSMQYFYLEHYAVMYHRAKAAASILNNQIRDNGGFSLSGGINLSSFLPLDSACISIGGIISYDRVRGDYDFRYPKSTLIKLYMEKNILGLRGTFHFGDRHSIVYGESLYHAREYIRLDFILKPFRETPANGKIELSFHFIEGELNFSQLGIINIGWKGGIPLPYD